MSTTETKTTETSGQGKIKVTCLPFDSTLERNKVSFNLSPVPHARGGLDENDKFKAGYLGISIGLAATDTDLVEHLMDFFASDKSIEKGSDIVILNFHKELLEYFNQTYCKPAWNDATTSFKPNQVLDEANKAIVLKNFRDNLNANINALRGEREKSSIQINVMLAKVQDQIKLVQPDLKALLTTYKLKNLGELRSRKENTLEETKLVETADSLIKERDELKLELELAKLREAEKLAKLAADASEIDELMLS